MGSKSAFRQSDVTRAIKAVRAAGGEARIEITDHKITIVPGKSGDDVTDLDRELTEFEARNGQA